MIGRRHLSLSGDDINRKVLHRGVQHLLYGAAQAMDLVDKQHVALVEIRQQGCQIAGLLDRGSAGDADIHAQLVGDDTGERRLAQSGRSVEQHVVKGFVADLCRLNIDAQVFLCLFLSDIFVQILWAQRILSLNGIGRDFGRVHYAVFKVKFIRKMRVCHLTVFPSALKSWRSAAPPANCRQIAPAPD